ncbi:MAG: alpha/beta hydrolase [Victivallaceae bacterium]|nr:alpha/beta hydrolase [Victivallaceae bacterium]
MKKLFPLFFCIAATAAALATEPFRIPLYPENSPEIKPEEKTPVLSVYPAAKPAGTILILPGGGYRSCVAGREGVKIAEKFRTFGFTAAVLDYRVSPDRYPAPQRDALRAVKLLRARAKEWNVDPEHLAVLGFSAGGHLAGCTGTLYDRIDIRVGDEADAQSARPDALILCYPVVSLAADFGHTGSGDCLLGKEASDAERKTLSLQNLVTDDTPPAFLWHTAGDTTVPCRNSIEFAQAMWAHNRTAELHVFPEGNHGKDTAENLKTAWQWPQMAANFLLEVGNFPVAK